MATNASNLQTLLYRIKNLILVLLALFFVPSMVFAIPGIPSPLSLCKIEGSGEECVTPPSVSAPLTTASTGVFPGTNLKFRPGIVVDLDQESPSPAFMESRWQQLFTASPNRKASYRPAGVYGGILYSSSWYRFYTDQNIRPKNPLDHADPGYNWSALDAAFNINAVQNEGALIVLSTGLVGWGGQKTPAWFRNAPYDGVWDANPGTEVQWTPKFYRYSGPDIRGQKDVGQGPPLVDEYIYFLRAMHDHLVATGNIGKVMYFRLNEFSPYGNFPADYNNTDFFHGVGLYAKLASEVWAKSGIQVTLSTLSGSAENLDILWQYMNSSKLGINFPDMKMSGTNSITSANTRFSDRNGVYQKDLRFLAQALEGNGHRPTTYFAPGIPNPWGYSDVTVPQTIFHIIWALSGPPKGANKDSNLGQPGNDPSGVLPVHNVVVSWDIGWQSNSPTLKELHQALDTFGPPGTFAFPYLPPGYVP